MALASVSCGGTPDNTIDVTFDPCSTRIALSAPTEDQRLQAEAAIEMWNEGSGFALMLDDSASQGSLSVQFEDAADAIRGLYDDERGLMFINQRLSGHALAVTLAHELGHSFGLHHVSGKSSVMNPGNTKVEPTSLDIEHVAGLWGTCDVQ